jgi:glutamyl-tRNA synthetase
MSKVRTRFAPSPTGYLHIGGARTALFSWLYARAQGGSFVLRIEDTDMARSTQESVDMLIRDLKWLGLDWDEGPALDGKGSIGPKGPYFQSQRLELYAGYLKQLEAKGLAYPSFEGKEEFSGLPATPEEIAAAAAKGEKPAWRFKIPESGVTEFEDLVHGRTRFENKLMGDFVIVRKDGVPTYNFAATVDDAVMGITHVIRGDDHLSNTPRQVCLYQALGFEVPHFAHIPMILGPDKQRLSKRHGATAVGEFEQQGFLPEALLNYLALLGWSLDDKTTLISKDDLVKHFSLERVTKHAAVFDPVKLEWMNGQYVKKKPLAELAALAKPHFERAGFAIKDAAWFERLVKSLQEKVRTLASLPGECAFFFKDSVELSPEAKQKFFAAAPEGAPWLEELASKLEGEAAFGEAALEPAVRGFAEAKGLAFKNLVAVLRGSLSGQTVTPGIFETLSLLGKEASLKRLRAAARWSNA